MINNHPDMGQDACVSAFTAVTRASDTNGLGLDTAVWTRFGHRRGGGGQDSGRGVGHGGMPAHVTMRRDLINLCQNSQGLLQTPTMAL